MSTTMTSVLDDIQQTSSFLLPLSTSDFDTARVVRFDNTCVLIPEPSKRPKPLKIYSLPLWKKRSGESEAEAATASSRVSLSTEDTHVVFKVPIPRFISRSPSRGRSASASPKPLSPCLVHRDPSTSPSPTRPRGVRIASLPISTSGRPKDNTALTVPLRPCCTDCVTVTEESLREGESWQEKFSRGARRRRSASLDSNDHFGHSGILPTSPGGIHRSTVFAAVASNALEADVGPTAMSRYRTSAFSITVDEVDRRRKSQEYNDEDLKRFRSPSARTSSGFHSPTGPYSAAYLLGHQPPEKEASTSSTSSSTSASSELSPHDIPLRRLKSSPIQEEDEDQLFPLPSPRRTPTNSPTPSMNASPAASPNTSTSCLSPAAAASKDNLFQSSNNSDEVLAKSLSRKFAKGNGLLRPSALQPPPTPNTSTVPESERSATSPSMPTPPGTSSSPSTTRLAPLFISTSPSLIRANSNLIKPLPSPPPFQNGSGNSTMSPTTGGFRPLPSPPASNKIPVSSSLPSTSNFGPRSPSSSPTVSQKPRRPSFSLPAIKGAIKGAGTDILKGVSSFSGGGIAGSV